MERLPAMTFRATTSIFTISQARMSMSRSESRRTKCVATPCSSKKRKSTSDMRLLRTPLSWMVPRFWALNAVASSLKCWMSRSGSEVR